MSEHRWCSWKFEAKAGVANFNNSTSIKCWLFTELLIFLNWVYQMPYKKLVTVAEQAVICVYDVSSVFF